MANSSDNKTIPEIVRELETAYISGEGTLMSKYVTSDLYLDSNKISAYLNSKHVSGETDAQGREKPFFNIVLSARNIYYRATDIDRKNIQVKSKKSKEQIEALMATVLLQGWMKRANFGTFLNNWGIELAGFNSSVVKFVEQDGELKSMVVPWSRLIVDSINFDSNPKIELIEVTEAELYQRKGYDPDMVEKLCDALHTRELTDHSTQDSKSNYVKLYEIHGVLPLSLLTDKEEDEDTYVQQMHVISFVASKEKGKYDDFTLVSGREDNDPYMLTALLPATDGSVSLDGSVKNLFEAQWMMNHNAKSIKDQLDVASKLIFQTADGNYVGRNVLSAIEQGDILVHAENRPLTQINNTSHDITAQQNFASMWKNLSSEINGVSESMLGNVAPSGTAWRQVQALLNESHSLFELMTENKGLYLEQMLRKYVIPYIKKKMDTSEEISLVLDSFNISKIDTMYVPAEATRRDNAQIKRELFKAINDPTLLSPNPQQPDNQATQAIIQKELQQQGGQRYFKPSDISTKTWKEVIKDMEWDLDINITGEAQDEQGVMDTLNTALVTVMNPLYASNKQAQFIVGKILNATGAISPMELASIPEPAQPVSPASSPTPSPIQQPLTPNQ